jgi:hypothetical protein
MVPGFMGAGFMGAGFMGAGLIRLAPGDPAPWAGGALTADCGETNPRVCAKACPGAQRIIPTAPAAAVQRNKALNPHPAIVFFLVLNHGNFMPPATRPATNSASIADSVPLSPYPVLRLVAGVAAAGPWIRQQSKCVGIK